MNAPPHDRRGRPWFIIPVHNRRETTLRCLQHLQADGVRQWATLCVIDDGSSDGTSEAIVRRFPEVRLLAGSGDLWWTGAVELGMRTAFAEGAECCVWLNDDTLPRPGACAAIIDTMRKTGAVVTGQCFIPPDGPLVYGGLVRQGIGLVLHPDAGDTIAPADAACGNFVSIPRSVIERIGFPDGRHLPHAFGDSDYTLRASQAGFSVLIEPRAIADAWPNSLANYASWLLSDIRVADIWRQLVDKRSYAYAPAHLRFLARHFGLRGVLRWISTVAKRVPVSIARILLPQSWLRRLWADRSAAWSEEQKIRRALRPPEPPHAE